MQKTRLASDAPRVPRQSPTECSSCIVSRILSCGRHPLVRITCHRDQFVPVKIGKLRVYNRRLLVASRQAIPSTRSSCRDQSCPQSRPWQRGVDKEASSSGSHGICLRAANSISLFPFHGFAALARCRRGLRPWTFRNYRRSANSSSTILS